MVRVAIPGATAFCLDRTEVTSGDYQRCVDSRGCPAAGASIVADLPTEEIDRQRIYCTGARQDRAAHPINCVDRAMAQAYCSWRRARLPTEAEWELAARGNTGRRFPWGNWAPAANMVNACGPECALRPRRGRRLPRPGGDAFPSTMPAGALLAGASECGALDLAGNVAEWVATDGPGAIARGGGWTDDAVDGLQSTSRRALEVSARLPDLGFRCVADVVSE
ncbi:MAG: SUMF1/EgtB/PvdO family nonheme iron enzyme [Phycisphaerales bacterium]|nr:SUMF1/EgtB/PvdO family nonheme iron enzyme [Phycisphaerales bacterium]